MKAKLTSLALGLALLAGSGAPGMAADWGSGGDSIKDGGAAAGVPVPAPIPVPVYESTWYFRFDVTAGVGSDPDATESGMLFGEGNARYRAAPPFGVPDSAVLSDYETNMMYGVGVGYQFSERLRGDVTLESRREQHVRIHGTVNGDLESTKGGGGFPAGTFHPEKGYYEAQFDDDTKVRGAVTLVNAYYDFAGWGRLTPYIGGGLGFAYNRVKRENSIREIAHDQGCCATTEVIATDSDAQTEASAAFAAAVSVGLTYELSDYFDLDVSYRYMHIGSTEIDIEENGHNSRLTIDGSDDHQLRAGLRWNVF